MPRFVLPSLMLTPVGHNVLLQARVSSESGLPTCKLMCYASKRTYDRHVKTTSLFVNSSRDNSMSFKYSRDTTTEGRKK